MDNRSIIHKENFELRLIQGALRVLNRAKEQGVSAAINPAKSKKNLAIFMGVDSKRKPIFNDSKVKEIVASVAEEKPYFKADGMKISLEEPTKSTPKKSDPKKEEKPTTKK